MYGEKVNDETVSFLLKAVDRSVALLQPSGPNVILDMLPWTRHFSSKQYDAILEAANDFKSVINAKIAERRVIMVSYMNKDRLLLIN